MKKVLDKGLGIYYSAVAIKDENNLNKATFEYIFKNFQDIVNNKQQGIFYATNEKELMVITDEMGIPFGVKLKEKYIELIKKVFSFYDDEAVTNLFNQYLKKEHIYNIDYYDCCLNHPSISPRDIGILSLYANNIETFNEFLNIFDNCDKELTKLILKIIKPMSMEFFEYFKLQNKYINEKDKKYPDELMIKTGIVGFFINEENWGCDRRYIHFANSDIDNVFITNVMNVYFIKIFEYWFTKNNRLIKDILKNDNSKDLLKELLIIKLNLFKECPIVSWEEIEVPIYSTEEYFPIYGRRSIKWKKCIFPVRIGTEIIDKVDYGNIDQLEYILSIIVAKLLNTGEKEITKKKVRKC